MRRKITPTLGMCICPRDEEHDLANEKTMVYRIIHDFYLPQVSTLRMPKIFGMTASPVDARVDIVRAAQ